MSRAVILDRLNYRTVTLRCARRRNCAAGLRASKGDGPVCGRFILRGSLRSHLQRQRRSRCAGMMGRHTVAFSRRDAPEVFKIIRPQNERAQGRPGARCTRGLACNVHKEVRTRAYRFSGSIPAFPAQWLYGLLRALPGERASCHRHRRIPSANLTPPPRRQDHTTSPYASCAFVLRAFRVHRIPPRVRDVRTPLLSGETGGIMPLICPTAKAKYF